MVEEKTKITTAPKKKETSSLRIPAFMPDGSIADAISVSHTVFGVNASDKLLAQYVYVYLQNQRAGTADTQTRGEVTGSTRKIYRQKGTGRARHGSRYAPIFVGGGVAHGPKAYKRVRSLNKKQRQKALLYALSLRLKDGDIMVLVNVAELEGKTKAVAGLMSHLNLAGSSSVLFIYNPTNEKSLAQSVRNIVNATGSSATSINAYEVLRHSKLVFTKEGLDSFLTQYTKHEKQ